MFFTLLAVAAATILLVVPLQFQARRRMNRANLPERWRACANSFHDWRMWHVYKDEAPARGWPVWPYYVYVAQYVEGVLLLIAALFVGVRPE
jgi:hypothetical protein